MQNLRTGGWLHFWILPDRLTVPKADVHHNPFLLSLVVLLGQKGKIKLFLRVIKVQNQKFRFTISLVLKKAGGNWHGEFLTWKGGLLLRQVKTSSRYENWQRFQSHCVLQSTRKPVMRRQKASLVVNELTDKARRILMI